jgi:hypothetical protein
MNPYMILLEMKKMLRNLDTWMKKAEGVAQAKKFDPAVLMQSRLAPDMLPFVRQVQIACDSAKFAAARLTGKEAPSHADTEATFADLYARIGKVTSYLETFSEAEFSSARERTVTHRSFGEKPVPALDYFVEHAIPNFFFHITTAYAVLRHNGIDIGKKDYLGQLTGAQ